MPPITRSQKVRLGVFLGVGLAALVGGLIILAGAKLGETRDRYLIRFRDAAVSLSGLEVGSPVKYSGIRVGRVESVKIDPEDVAVILVELTLDHKTPVAEDTKANLGSQGITGLKYIELTRGTAGARVRKPGEEIPPGTSLFDTLSQSAEAIAKKVEVVLDRVADIAGPDQKERIAKLLDRTEHLLGTLDDTLTENRESLKTLAARVAATSEQIEALAGELAGTARRANGLLSEATQLLKNAKDTPQQLNAFLVQGTAILGESRTFLGVANGVLIQTRSQLVEAVGLVREAAENASAFTQKLRDDPSLLLRGGGSEAGEE